MRNAKKSLATIMAVTLALSMSLIPTLADDTGSGAKTDSILKKTSEEKEFDGSFFSISGFAAAKVNDRSDIKEGDTRYRVANNEVEFLTALNDAKNGVVKVIELRADMNLGWWELSQEAKVAGSGIISAYSGLDSPASTPYTNPTLVESGLSDLRLSNIDGLTIFSQTGNTIKHTQFQLQNTVNDFVMRNISINEVWEWDDFRGTGFGALGGKGDHKRVGWSPMKINGSKNVWLDHCSFGLGFDGCVDLENGAEGVSITWCKIGDTDESIGSMIYKTAMYMEQLYQESIEKNNPKWAFTAYRIMRDNGMTVEQIMEYMAYHSKVHLCGAGDKDTWLVEDTDENGNLIIDYSDGMIYTEELIDNLKENGTSSMKEVINQKKIASGMKFGTVLTHPNFEKTDANELIELSLGYNQYWNIGQRVPMIRGGVGHLYNCYVNDSGSQKTTAYLAEKDETGKKISEQIKEAGSKLGKSERTMNARNGASIAADTCVWQNVSQPVPGAQYQKEDIINMNAPYHEYFTYNYSVIVNSKVQLASDKAVYVGNSYDNNGDNPFMNNFTWKDPAVAFSWHNLAIKNAYRDKGVTDEAVALADYDKLTYSYKTLPLEKVEEITNMYSGYNKVKMSAEDWLKTSYSEEFVVDVIDESDLVEPTQVKLSKNEAVVYMAEDEHLQIDSSVIPSYSNKTVADLVWTSSDENIAKVNNCGLVTPVGYGKATIKATLPNGLYAECIVDVRTSPSTINVVNIPETIYTGDIFTLKAELVPADVDNQNVIWNTLSRNIDILDKKTGVFQAVKAGRRLAINVASEFTANRVGYEPVDIDYNRLTVVDPDVAVTGITFDKTVLSSPITVDNSVQLNASVVPADATNKKIYWTSSDESVATVDNTGKVTAIKEGSAIIEAKTMNYGFVSTCEAVVVNKTDDPTPTPEIPTPTPEIPTPTPEVPTPTPEVPTPTPGLNYELGDVDMNGTVDLDDVMIVLKAALGIQSISDDQKVLADMDKNTVVDLTDCIIVLRKALGIEI